MGTATRLVSAANIRFNLGLPRQQVKPSLVLKNRKLCLPPDNFGRANSPMRRITGTVGLAFLLALAACGGTTRPPQGNLVRNGGFEQGMADWQFLVSGASATGQLDSAEKHEGKCSFKISNQSAFAPNVYARIVQTMQGLRPFVTYKASCWVKGKGGGINWIGGGPGWYTRTALPKGDFDWQEVSFEVTTGAEADNYELMVLTESRTEALWVDDIRFEPVTVDQAKQDAVYAQIDSTIASLRRRLEGLKKTNNAYLRLGRAVAQRFIRFRQDRRAERANEPGLDKNATRSRSRRSLTRQRRWRSKTRRCSIGRRQNRGR